MGGSSSKPSEGPKSKYFSEYVENSIPNLKGKTIAVTGCTSGTGLVFAKVCAEKEADAVLLLNRPSERATKAQEQVQASCKSKETKVESIDCDLQDFESVRKAAKQILQKYDKLDVLCNNAGVMALEDVATKDGYDVQMQTNHLSHFLLTKDLFPLIQKASTSNGSARIVQHSSAARHGSALEAKYLEKNGGNLGGNGSSMFFGGARWARYHQTKLANVVFMAALADKCKNTSIISSASAPGLASTQLSATAGAGMQGSMWIMKFAQSGEDGTLPLLEACFGESTKNGDFWEPKDWNRFSGLPGKFDLDKVALNVDSQKMLWEKSEEACGKFDIN